MFTIALIFYKYTSNIVVSIALKKKRIQGRGAEGEEKARYTSAL
jgi:hypothetical protein